MIWGLLLSSSVFFCTIFGINQLLRLCDLIEGDKNNGMKELTSDIEQNGNLTKSELDSFDLTSNNFYEKIF